MNRIKFFLSSGCIAGSWFLFMMHYFLFFCNWQPEFLITKEWGKIKPLGYRVYPVAFRPRMTPRNPENRKNPAFYDTVLWNSFSCVWRASRRKSALPPPKRRQNFLININKPERKSNHSSKDLFSRGTIQDRGQDCHREYPARLFALSGYRCPKPLFAAELLKTQTLVCALSGFFLRLICWFCGWRYSLFWWNLLHEAGLEKQNPLIPSAAHALLSEEKHFSSLPSTLFQAVNAAHA